MKITVDGEDLYELTPLQEKVIMNDVHEDVFEADMKRRLHWVLTHKYDMCLKTLKDEWVPKFIATGTPIPIQEADFARAILCHPDYRSRKQRDAERNT